MNDFSNYHLSCLDIYALVIVLHKKRFVPKQLSRSYENLHRYRLILQNSGDERNEIGENLPDGTYSVNYALAREYLISLRQGFYRSLLLPAIVAFITAYLTAQFSC